LEGFKEDYGYLSHNLLYDPYKFLGTPEYEELFKNPLVIRIQRKRIVVKTVDSDRIEL
jgi:hypothetical protein